MKHLIELTDKQLDKVIFAVKSDYETVADNIEDWTVGEALELEEIMRILGALKEDNDE